jgi:hypothetical protein
MSRCHLIPAAALIVLSTLGCGEQAQRQEKSAAATADSPSIALTDRVVDLGCAQCMFGLDRPGCETAIRVDGLVYLATGAGVPDAEDHASGMCDSIHQGKVSGTTAGSQFVATSVVLLP